MNLRIADNASPFASALFMIVALGAVVRRRPDSAMSYRARPTTTSRRRGPRPPWRRRRSVAAGGGRPASWWPIPRPPGRGRPGDPRALTAMAAFTRDRSGAAEARNPTLYQLYQGRPGRRVSSPSHAPDPRLASADFGLPNAAAPRDGFRWRHRTSRGRTGGSCSLAWRTEDDDNLARGAVAASRDTDPRTPSVVRRRARRDCRPSSGPRPLPLLPFGGVVGMTGRLGRRSNAARPPSAQWSRFGRIDQRCSNREVRAPIRIPGGGRGLLAYGRRHPGWCTAALTAGCGRR